MPLARLPESMAAGHFRYVYLAWLGSENQVTGQRARSLARLARERGVALSAAQFDEYREKVERDRQLSGDCIAEVQPLTLAPVPVVGASGP